MPRTVFFSVLLLVLAAVPALALTPLANSQSMTTVTSFITASSPTTNTITGTTTIVSSTPTEVTVTSTSYLAHYLSLYWNEKFDLRATTGNYGCWYDDRESAEPAGTVIVGNVTSDNPISFFIMSNSQFTAWTSGNSCSVANSLFQAYGTTQTSFNLILPESGVFYFVVLNFSTSNEAKGQLDAQIIGSATMNEQMTSVEITVESYSTQTTVMTAPWTSQTLLIQTVQPFTGGSNQTLLVAAVIAALVAVGVALTLRSRRRFESPSIKCVECGAALLPNAKFCKKCGAQIKQAEA